YSSLSSKVLRSKAGNGSLGTSNSRKTDGTENGRTGRVQDNSNTSNAEKKIVKRDSEIFYNNYLLKTSSVKSYEIDGVSFSSEEIDAVRSVVQNAVSPLLGGKFYYDYKDYAQMGIAENSVVKYAAENLTEEQAQVVNQSLSGYISGLLDKEEEWINSECYIDDTEGVGDTGEMNTYYGVRLLTAQWIRDGLDAVLANFNAAAAKYKVYKQGSGSKAASGDNSADGRNGGLVYCASNKGLARNIRSLFAGTDLTDDSQLADAFKEYKGMMTVAYRAVGFGRTTNDMLKDDTNSFTKQISNMKAVLSGINRNGIDNMF
ncbi:MAG TPA: hypothetical protein DDY31_08340, partial [Lachnospiraceae bacterium]|nr:hypothetical protein [Lachnospiraceae bacterium]